MIELLATTLETSLPTVTSLKRAKKVLRILGIAELTMGIMCTTIGVMLMIDSQTARYIKLSKYSSYVHLVTYINLAEGIWCGVWLVAAGVTGVVCGKKTVTPCMINWHLTFSIIGTIFSFILMIISVLYFITYLTHYPFGMVMEIILTVLGFAGTGACFSSAKYCPQATTAAGVGGCCGGGCSEEPLHENGPTRENGPSATTATTIVMTQQPTK